MENKEKEISERVSGYENRIAEGLKAQAKMEENKHRAKNNRLWLWLGVLILVAILLWWLFTIGTFDALVGTANG